MVEEPVTKGSNACLEVKLPVLVEPKVIEFLHPFLLHFLTSHFIMVVGLMLSQHGVFLQVFNRMLIDRHSLLVLEHQFPHFFSVKVAVLSLRNEIRGHNFPLHAPVHYWIFTHDFIITYVGPIKFNKLVRHPYDLL